VTINDPRSVDGFPNAFRNPFGLSNGDVITDDDEFVSAESSNRVAGPDNNLDPGHRLSEQAVADPVAQGVVHHLEVVHIEEDHTQLRSPLTAAGEALVQPVCQQRPIR